MRILHLLFAAALVAEMGLGVCAGKSQNLSPGLEAIAPEVLVVAGKGAPAVEWAAATRIAEAFRAAGGPPDNLLDDEAAFIDLSRTAFSHLVLVGTYGSNEMLRQQWGHSAIDRVAFAKETVLPKNVLRTAFYDGAPNSGFYVHGYGTFRKSTGYVEGGRNDLYLVPAAVGAPEKPSYRIRINVAGSDSAGVERAARAFLDGSMLGGVLPSEKVPKQGDALILGKDRYATELPEFFPREELLGWIQPDAIEYAGFLQASGKPALREFLRQRGGLILLITAEQGAWHVPFSFVLPTTFYRPGPGWGTAAAARNVRLLPVVKHPAIPEMDWSLAPPVHSVWHVAPPDGELFRGALQLIAPREQLIKPLLNAQWTLLMMGDDAERSPAAVAGSYGRGRIVVWGADLGRDFNGEQGETTEFTSWEGFVPLWRAVAQWVCGAGKTASPAPSIFIAGAGDRIIPKAWGKEDPGATYHRIVSYPLEDFGLSRTHSADAASAALVLEHDQGTDAALAQMQRAGKPLPARFDGTLKGASPLSDAIAQPPAFKPITIGEPAPAPPPAPQRQQPPPVPRLEDAALQPPSEWKFKATNSVTFQRDMTERWYSADFDDSAWEARPAGSAAQTVGGLKLPYYGTLWYRAAFDRPAEVPEDAVWTFQAGAPGSFHSKLQVWVDGIEQELDGTSLRLENVKRGRRMLAVRIFNSGGASYWQASRELAPGVQWTTRCRPAACSSARPNMRTWQHRASGTPREALKQTEGHSPRTSASCLLPATSIPPRPVWVLGTVTDFTCKRLPPPLLPLRTSTSPR